ncbi:unnamed protein product, partial [Discosporangium mesarthrocarpum]
QVIPITIPRVFYVNSLVSSAGATRMGRRVNRTLPNGHTPSFLHEVAMDEDAFQRGEKRVSKFLLHPDVEGVYELGTPALYRACLHLGCVARVAPGRAGLLKDVRMGAGQVAGFELEDLELVTTAMHPYLDPSVSSFRRIYMYHSRSKRRGMLAVFYVQGTNEEIEREPEELTST